MMSSSMNILAPEVGSSFFPRRSFYSKAPSLKFRRVRFAKQLTDTYVIAPRTCKRGYSVSLEEVHNRVRRVRRELEKELAELDDQREIELRLEEENESLFDQYAPVMTLVEFNKSIAKLTARLSQLDEDISVMKMDLLRLKGAIRSFRNNAGGKNRRGSIETLSLSNWNPFRRGSCNF